MFLDLAKDKPNSLGNIFLKSENKYRGLREIPVPPPNFLRAKNVHSFGHRWHVRLTEMRGRLSGVPPPYPPPPPSGHSLTRWEKHHLHEMRERERERESFQVKKEASIPPQWTKQTLMKSIGVLFCSFASPLTHTPMVYLNPFLLPLRLPPVRSNQSENSKKSPSHDFSFPHIFKRQRRRFQKREFTPC